MIFVEICPKCRGKVQTKVIKKAFGLGFVEIPVAQFCLNPECDWYQDFSEAKKPEDIKEKVLQIRLKHVVAVAGIVAAIAVILVLSSL